MARRTRGRVRIQPLASDEAARLLPGVPEAERFEQAWLIGGGQIHGGHEAVWHSLYLIPGGGFLKPYRWVPGFHPISRALYRWVAANRRSACRLIPPEPGTTSVNGPG